MRSLHSLSKNIILAIAIAIVVGISTVAHAVTISNFPAGFTFTKNLKYGMTDPDVMRLQQVLNTNSATRVAIGGPGSSGNETTYFGNLTKTAVINFQQLYSSQILAPLGLASGTGYVGPSTRAKLNSIISGGITASSQCPAGYVCTPNNQNSTTATTYPSYYNSNASYNTSTGITSGTTNTGIQPTVTLLANGQTGSITEPVTTDITLFWLSANAAYCSSNPTGQNQMNANGTMNYEVTQSGTITIYCFSAGGGAPGSASVVINATSNTGINTNTSLSTVLSLNQTASTTSLNTGGSTSGSTTGNTGTGSAVTQCPTGYICTLTNQNSGSTTTTVSASPTIIPVTFPTIVLSSATSTATSTTHTATSTEMLDYGTVTGVFPCTFDPGNFYVGFTVSSSTPIVPKTASSTNTSSATSATSTHANTLGDKHYVWVLGTSQVYMGGSEITGGFLPSLPPLGDVLDMVIKKTNQSCDPQGGGYLIEKAYIRATNVSL